ncbi:MAG: indole-3-glycerol-phosphate synthase TrpC, partial [Gelidibacter sp.]
MNILDHIVADKRKEVDLRRSLIPSSQLEQSVLFERANVSLTERLKNSTSGIIAEHKRRSPSKSVINQTLNVFDVAQGYESAGVCGMS